jgi:tetratricopeptide (TPR) repeat protein
VGSDAQLDAVCEQVGRHALSVAVIGSYLSHFEAGRVEAAATLQLDAIAGDDPKAAKLARVLAFYADRLPDQERELLARLAVFPRGITVKLLGMLVDAGGQVAGVLVNARPALARLLQRLVDRGLVFRYAAADGTLNWTAHPFVRERFAALLGCPAEAVFDVVAQRIGHGLAQRPEKKPEAVALLDRYEQLIEVTRLAGRVQQAFDLYWDGLGSFIHLGWKLGEYARAYRILRCFLPASGDPKGFGEGLSEQDQSLGLNDLSLMARLLGRLHEAADLRREDDARSRVLGEPKETSRRLQNTSEVALDLGHLGEALAAASEALREAEQAKDDDHRKFSLAYRANAHHGLGDIAAARADFAAATALEDKPMLYSGLGQWHARHHLDLGQPDACRAIAEAGIRIAQRNEWNFEIPGWQPCSRASRSPRRRTPAAPSTRSAPGPPAAATWNGSSKPITWPRARRSPGVTWPARKPRSTTVCGRRACAATACG